MSDIVAVDNHHSIKIVYGSRQDGLLSSQIPVHLISSVDDVFRWALEGGRQVVLTFGGSGDPRAAFSWKAECNGIGGTGPTPWSAFQSLAKAISNFKHGD